MNTKIGNDHWLVEKIKIIETKHKGRYNSRKIQAELEQDEVIRVNHNVYYD